MQSAELGMIILVDGFIMTSVILAASQFYPHILDYAIFGHQETKADISECSMRWESMHSCTSTSVSRRIRAVCAYPIIESAVRMINRMDSFQSVNVTKYF